MTIWNRTCVLACVLAGMAWCRGLLAAEGDFHVAPDGRDTSPGTRERPFATLARAQEAVRGLIAAERARGAARERPVTVLLRGGTYELESPLAFGREDSGTEAAPVVYAAAEDETPVISGGVRLKGWRRRRGKWSLEMPEVRRGEWRFSQLFVDGVRRFRPRASGGKYLFMRGDAPVDESYGGSGHNRFRYREDDIRADWHNRDHVEVLPFHSWSMSRMTIGDVDAERKVVSLRGRTWHPGMARLARGTRYLVENVREELDAPGEWYLDRKTGELTYVPMPGERPGRTEVVAPRLDRLVVIDGAEHLTFRGIAFMHTSWNVPEKGYSTPQAESPLHGAISAKGARGCTFERCTVAHVGVYAIEWGERCRDCLVERCELWDLGAGGVKIGTGWGGADENRIASRVAVRDSLIAHIGRMHPAAVGVWIGSSPHNTVEHNDIFDTYYTGVSAGWSWGFRPSPAHHNTIAYNHIHHIGQGRLDDQGGIYTLGVSPGTVLRFNHIHDVERVHYGGWGIYLDEGTSGLLAENNLVHDTEDPGFNMHYGGGNTIRNNVFAFGRNAQIGPGRLDKSKSLTFERNIVYAPHGDLMRGADVRPDHRYDRNVYWSVKRDELKFAKGETLEKWRARGQDRNSVVADPLFADAERRDFRLRAGSPALGVGFEPFDVSSAGRRAEAVRRETPYGRACRRARRGLSRGAKQEDRWPVPHAYLEATLPGPEPIKDSFEFTGLGQPPADAQCFKNNDRETVSVTGETAATGERCLKITDGPGPGPGYNPHFHYNPGYKSGVLEGGFAIRLEPGSVADHEWRDWRSSPYRRGPALRFEPDGTLKAAGEVLVKLPSSEWVRIAITCGVGDASTGSYTVTVKLPGRAARRFEKLPCDAEFKALTWMGWTASGTKPAVFYLDDVYLRSRPGGP